MIIIKTFYKVIVLNIDIFETTIADERHFPDLQSAEAFAESQRIDGYVCVVVQI